MDWFVIGVAVGVAAGGAIAWMVAAAKAKAQSAGALAQVEGRAASAEGIVAELRGQIAKSAADARTLQQSLDVERQGRTQAQTQLAEAGRYFEEQKAAFAQAEARLTDTFKALSGDALSRNNQAFLDLAGKSFGTLLAEARGDVGKRQEAIDAVIKPLATSLQQYEEHVRGLEKSRVEAYAGLQEHLRNLSVTQQQLQQETGDLVTALRTPQVRGRWGEVTLHRVVELAGMSEHCDYSEQVSVESEAGRLRPDMVVHLPSQRDIVVDSKVSLEAYLRAISAQTKEEHDKCLAQHAQQIRTHMQALSGKQYWEQFARTPEFVVMFIPGESFFAAALDCDRALLEDGMKQRVVLATPTTLIALLQAVAYGWRGEQMAENAKIISELGRDLYDRIKVLTEHMVTLGRAVKRSADAFNSVAGSMNLRFLPAARKLQEYGVAGKEEIAEIEPVEFVPRLLDSPADVPAGMPADVPAEIAGDITAKAEPPPTTQA